MPFAIALPYASYLSLSVAKSPLILPVSRIQAVISVPFSSQRSVLF
nr:MAG TPA: hypothetical protein [Caudoviricetes sp.]